MKMKLLLVDHVQHLGRRGDIVDVAHGYGRNFLIPRGLAVSATEGNRKQLDVQRRKFEAKEASRKAEFASSAGKIAEQSWTIEAKTNEEGHLFGSVTYKDLATLVAAQGFDVDERAFSLVEADKYPIKEKGVYPFRIRLHEEVVAEAKLWVVEEGEKEKVEKVEKV